MPNLLVMSFEGLLAPLFTLHHQVEDAERPDGWGVGYYGHGKEMATVFKEAAPPKGKRQPALVHGSEQLASSLFMLQVRHARWGSEDSLANTQPFTRSWRGRDWMFAHGGSLTHRLEVGRERLFEPVGSTDSELIFCELMNDIADRRWRNLGYADFGLLHQWCATFDEFGTMNCALTDGRDLVVYVDQEAPLYMWELRPPYGPLILRDEVIEIDLAARGVKGHKGILVSSSPLEIVGGPEFEMTEIPPGSLLVIREGAIRQRVEPGAIDAKAKRSAPALIVHPVMHARPRQAPVRTYEVLHRTVYQYAKPVEHSTHMLRLTPTHDRLQRVLSHELDISVDCREREFDDVFGNQVRKLVVEVPYTELEIVARSRVRVLDTDPLSYRPLHARTTIPLVWMPWQRHMLTPYLLPPELPETQLLELIDYARSFVKRNDYDLLETLLDINATIFSDYEYVPGSTTLGTTAWEVYERRRGVCQDFTNLFICMARLLGVPARYACGYIYTGPKKPSRSPATEPANQIQSEASHAWVQLYLPEVGWKGFDPTNGILTQTDHVRVAVGRNYIDATPTSGTIYVGGGPEKLIAEVRVEPIDDEQGEAEDERSCRTAVTIGAVIPSGGRQAAANGQVQAQAQGQAQGSGEPGPDDDEH
ncbi:class II glutamine amidotransferase [Nannocystaceae bacterium ST9]